MTYPAQRIAGIGGAAVAVVDTKGRAGKARAVAVADLAAIAKIAVGAGGPAR